MKKHYEGAPILTITVFENNVLLKSTDNLGYWHDGWFINGGNV